MNCQCTQRQHSAPCRDRTAAITSLARITCARSCDAVSPHAFVFFSRPGLIGWVLLDLSFIAAQYKKQVTVSIILVVVFHAIYVLDALWSEASQSRGCGASDRFHMRWDACHLVIARDDTACDVHMPCCSVVSRLPSSPRWISPPTGSAGC